MNIWIQPRTWASSAVEAINNYRRSSSVAHIALRSSSHKNLFFQTPSRPIWSYIHITHIRDPAHSMVRTWQTVRQTWNYTKRRITRCSWRPSIGQHQPSNHHVGFKKMCRADAQNPYGTKKHCVGGICARFVFNIFKYHMVLRTPKFIQFSLERCDVVVTHLRLIWIDIYTSDI